MKRKTGAFLAICCIFTIMVSGISAADLSPEQLVSEHLKSIGDTNMLSQVKSISLIGNSEVNFILGMSGQMNGTSMLVSEGSQAGIGMMFDDINYPGEYFAYDGKNVTVGHIKPGLRSPIADFIYRYNKVMKNGIVGGVLSSAWPLLDIKRNRPNMKARKTKVDGAELYEIEYRPRDNHGEMTIRMYFDPETYRHVSTEYKVRTDNDMTAGGNNPFNSNENSSILAISQVRGESFYTLTERFDDFRKVGALTLPYSYTIDYMIDGTNQPGFIAKWKISAIDIGFNTPNIDKNLFKAIK